MEAGGINFGQTIKNDHPNIRLGNYEKYIDDYYESNKEYINKSLEETRNSIKQTEKIFFEQIKKIFADDFSDKKYTGIISIFNSNPRYIDKGIFQFYYKKEVLRRLTTIYHEALHFIFFDYVNKNFHELVKDLDENSGKYWDLSEIFNVIVLNNPNLKEKLKLGITTPYPYHKKIIATFDSLWEESSHDIKKFVGKGLVILDKTSSNIVQ